MRIKIFIYTISFIICTTSCKKLIEIDPPISSLSEKTAFENDAMAISVMTAIYTDLASNTDLASGGPFGFGGLSGMLTDELQMSFSSPSELEFNTASLSANNTKIRTIWNRAYNTIYRANSVLKGVAESESLSNNVKDQLVGEAKFTRAFMLFMLVNIYGNVPIPLTTDYATNTSLSRSSVNDVYKQIITDLTDAQKMLTPHYLSATNKTTSDRVRPNRFAATALLARVYLYIGEWMKAEDEATKVINETSFYQLEKDLNKVFLVPSKEAIWQIGFGPNSSGISTWDGYYYILLSSIYYMSNNLVDTMRGDKRLNNWAKSFIVSGDTSYHPFKYKVTQSAANSNPTEHTMVFRLAEQYLIRAEARAMQGRFSGINGANADLNVIRDRVDLPVVSPSDLTAFMPLLEKERRLELFSEWGHRWFDLKRWKGFSNTQITRADEVMPAILSDKGGTWEITDKLWPIPEAEVLINRNLDQNPGY